MAAKIKQTNQQPGLKLPSFDDLKKGYQDFTKGVDELGRLLPDFSGTPGGRTISQRNQAVAQSFAQDPGKISLTRLKSTVKPTIKALGNVDIDLPWPVDLKWKVNPQTTEDIADFVGGAYSITPFQAGLEPQNFARNVFGMKTPKTKAALLEEKFAPTTERGKLMERAGRFTYGLALAGGPKGGMPLTVGNVVGGTLARAGAGATLGTAFTGVGSLLQGKMPTGEELKEGAIRGVESSWKLAISDAITDKVISTSFPYLAGKTGLDFFKQDLTQKAVSQGYGQGIGSIFNPKTWTNETARKLLADGTKRYVERALLEVPVENVMFTAEDIISGRDKRDFVTALIQNIPREIAANLMFAGVQVAMGVPVKDDQNVLRFFKSKLSEGLLDFTDRFRPFGTPYEVGQKVVLPAVLAEGLLGVKGDIEGKVIRDLGPKGLEVEFDFGGNKQTYPMGKSFFDIPSKSQISMESEYTPKNTDKLVESFNEVIQGRKPLERIYNMPDVQDADVQQLNAQYSAFKQTLEEQAKGTNLKVLETVDQDPRAGRVYSLYLYDTDKVQGVIDKYKLGTTPDEFIKQADTTEGTDINVRTPLALARNEVFGITDNDIKATQQPVIKKSQRIAPAEVKTDKETVKNVIAELDDSARYADGAMEKRYAAYRALNRLGIPQSTIDDLIYNSNDPIATARGYINKLKTKGGFINLRSIFEEPDTTKPKLAGNFDEAIQRLTLEKNYVASIDDARNAAQKALVSVGIKSGTINDLIGDSTEPIDTAISYLKKLKSQGGYIKLGPSEKVETTKPTIDTKTIDETLSKVMVNYKKQMDMQFGHPEQMGGMFAERRAAIPADVVKIISDLDLSEVKNPLQASKMIMDALPEEYRNDLDIAATVNKWGTSAMMGAAFKLTPNGHTPFSELLQFGRYNEAFDYVDALPEGQDKQTMLTVLKSLGQNIATGDGDARADSITRSVQSLTLPATQIKQGETGFLGRDGIFTKLQGDGGEPLSDEDFINLLVSKGVEGADALKASDNPVFKFLEDTNSVRVVNSDNALLLQFKNKPTIEQLVTIRNLSHANGNKPLVFEFDAIEGAPKISKEFKNVPEFQTYLKEQFDKDLERYAHQAGFIGIPEVVAKTVRKIGQALGITPTEEEAMMEQMAIEKIKKLKDLAAADKQSKANLEKIKERPGLYTGREEAELRGLTARMFGTNPPMSNFGGIRFGNQLADFDLDNIARIKRVVDNGIPLVAEDGKIDPDGIALFHYAKQAWGEEKMSVTSLKQWAEDLNTLSILKQDPNNKEALQLALDKAGTVRDAIQLVKNMGVDSNVASNAVKDYAMKIDFEKGVDKIPAGPTNIDAEPGATKVPKYIGGNINSQRLRLPPENIKLLADELESFYKNPEVRAVLPKDMTMEDIVEMAQMSEPLTRMTTPGEQLRYSASLMKLRQVVAGLAEGLSDATPEERVQMKEDLKKYATVLMNQAKVWGQRGNVFKEMADPKSNTGSAVAEKLMMKLIKAGVELDDFIDELDKVDFSNPKSVTNFYKTFVKAGNGEFINELRYINLLSSPKTHLVNGFSNLLQAIFVAPTTRLYSGLVDTVASGLSQKDRKHYISSVAPYYRGMFSSIPEAFSDAKRVMSGEEWADRPDLNNFRVGDKVDINLPFIGKKTITNPLEATKMTKILDLLLASDIFFRKLIMSGELEAMAYETKKMGKNVNMDILEEKAAERAAYYLFRQPLDTTGTESGQGALLSGADKLTSMIYGLRKFAPARWFIPFVQTPMNILKQGIEYSPAGFATLYKKGDTGLFDKEEQFAKALMGSTVFAGAWALASAGRVTFAPPRGAEERKRFYASGRKPYSVNINGNWVSFTKLGPIAYPIAMAAAAQYHFNESPKSFTDDNLKKFTRTLEGMAGFFSGQSYIEGLGNLVDALQGEAGALEQTVTDVPRQLIPLSSLLGWVSRIVDPYYREIKSPWDAIRSGLPGLSTDLTPYEDPIGRPSSRGSLLMRGINSFAPGEISPANPEFEKLYQIKEATKSINNVKTQLKEGTIDEKKAKEALRNIVNKYDGAKNSKNKQSSLLDKFIKPAYAAEGDTPGAKMMFVYTYDPQRGMHVDSYGNPGPEQPGPGQDSYVYEYTYDQESGYYFDQYGNPSPLDIFIGNQNPELNLEQLIASGELSTIKSSTSTSSRSGGVRVSQPSLPSPVKIRTSEVKAPRVTAPKISRINVGRVTPSRFNVNAQTPNYVQLPKLKVR